LDGNQIKTEQDESNKNHNAGKNWMETK